MSVYCNPDNSLCKQTRQHGDKESQWTSEDSMACLSHPNMSLFLLCPHMGEFVCNLGFKGDLFCFLLFLLISTVYYSRHQTLNCHAKTNTCNETNPQMLNCTEQIQTGLTTLRRPCPVVTHLPNSQNKVDRKQAGGSVYSGAAPQESASTNSITITVKNVN